MIDAVLLIDAGLAWLRRAFASGRFGVRLDLLDGGICKSRPRRIPLRRDITVTAMSELLGLPVSNLQAIAGRPE